MELENNEKMNMVQVIICKCGSIFAACRVPDCYQDKEWLASLRKYSLNGYTIEVRDSFTIQKCICDQKDFLCAKTDDKCLHQCLTCYADQQCDLFYSKSLRPMSKSTEYVPDIEPGTEFPKLSTESLD